MANTELTLEEKLDALCQELFQTSYEDETPFGKSVVRRVMRERENKITEKVRKEFC